MDNTILFDFARGLKERLDAWLNEGRAEAMNWIVEGVTITCGSLEANREIRGYNPRPGAVGC
ncbi:MAG: hypothetical protein HGA45_10380 [Chloroflexales bacterium]|nr:hypothetical protein [Chloroflexales bacterium]